MTTRAINPTGVLATDHAALQAALDASQDGDIVLMRHRNVGNQHTAWQLCPTVREVLGAVTDAQTAFTLTPRGSTPQKVYLAVWDEANAYGTAEEPWAPVLVLKASPADYSINGNTLTWANGSLKAGDMIVVQYTADPYDFTIKLPRAGIGGSSEMSLQKVVDNGYYAIWGGGYFNNFVNALEYKKIDVQKAVTIRGETGDDNVPLTELQMPRQDDTVKVITEIPLDGGGNREWRKALKYSADYYAGFICHNSKTATFENLVMNDGLGVINAFGPPTNLRNCKFVRCGAMTFEVDDVLSYPNLDSGNPYSTVNPSVVTECVFDNCLNGLWSDGGTLQFTHNRQTPCTLAHSLHDAFGVANLDLHLISGLGHAATANYFFMRSLSTSLLQDYVGGMKMFHSHDSVISHNEFDFGWEETPDNNTDRRTMYWCLGSFTYAGGFVDGVEYSQNVIKNTKYNVAFGGGYTVPIFINTGAWYEWWWGIYDEQGIKNIVIADNTFEHTSGLVVVDNYDIGIIEDILFSGNDITDCAIADDAMGAALYTRSFVALYSEVAGAEIVNGTYTGNDWADSGWTTADVLYQGEDEIGPESAKYSINHHKGREKILPEGATSMESFVAGVLTNKSPPYHNDFKVGKKAKKANMPLRRMSPEAGVRLARHQSRS